MQQNIILAGVGGQGILTIAKAISGAAVARGLNVKQAEVHGMSQRGGAVQSHLRLSDEPIHSDLIPSGRVDLILAVEPLEALRYVHMLAPDGVVVASANAFVNIPNYPPVEQVIDRISALPRHVVVDADRLAKAAGSARSSNVVLLGAASEFLCLGVDELNRAISLMLDGKGPAVVTTNIKALALGRASAAAYLEGLDRGGTSRAVRRWVDSLAPDALLSTNASEHPSFDPSSDDDHLSGAESHAVERLLQSVYESDRRQLYEHEVYQIVQLVGAISPPHHVFLGVDNLLSEESLAAFPGDQVVLKIVSPDVVHKSDAQGVVFCPKQPAAVEREVDRLINLHRSRHARVDGVLVVEFVERGRQGLGEELFVGIRATREFGPVVAAGLGGVDTEYLARVLRPGVGVAKAVATETTAEQFFELFRGTAAYDMISGRVRGHRRIVSDGELLRCFRAFIAIARRFCVDRGQAGPDVAELEVNPFAFRRQHLVPLDGRARLATATRRPLPRPIGTVSAMLEPRSIAVLGVSAKEQNFGRIILRNIMACGFPRENLTVVKEGVAQIDEVRCVPGIDRLPGPTDLLVVAAGASQLPDLVDQCIASGKISSLIVIPGGAGETEGSQGILERVRESLAHSRQLPGGGPILLGPNCLGVQSRPGKYDTFFIPDAKLDKRRDRPGKGVAFISQSGAFIITRLSNLETLDPLLTISIGNQADLTISDVIRSVASRNDIHTIGAYVEGFNDLDGLDMLKAIRDATAAGKTTMFYKAGRSSQGRDAAAGHTASIAGDYDICEAGATAAGALVADSFTEFERLLELSAAFHATAVTGTGLAAISNAGYETVGIADRVLGGPDDVVLPALESGTRERLIEALREHGLAGLVNARNPLDLTPMASEAAYEAAAMTLAQADGIDALLVSAVPLTPTLSATAAELERGRGSLVDVIERVSARCGKPVVAVVDSGAEYHAFVRLMRDRGIPVFRSADQAVRALGRYLTHRVRTRAAPTAAVPAAVP